MSLEYKVTMETWAVWRKDDTARALSSSGGMAAVVSEAWIRDGGIVYGAAFVKPFNFKHIRCTTLSDLARLRGSKYVHSSIKGVSELISKDINAGKHVLFIGTPCQVAGVKSRFGDAVCTIDIICHGTPRVETLKASIPQKALQMDFDNVEFRNNGEYKISFKKAGQTVWSRPLAHDLYIKGFFKALFNRECCYSCKFARKERISDMTLGDFWGLDMTSVNTTMNKGISLVLVNSDKGKHLLNMVKNEIEMIERPLAEAVAGNNPLRHPMPSTWRHHVYNVLGPLTGFRFAAIAAMPDVVLKNIFK
ncbi:MAG: Coenzyme F420 hydrogenase/dehydrogenase, beta subunit C-terminal domain [Clostridium sp.]|nr:Coenzyme F420 hydrogenase/dehydrogenase, beta subunit C-terminal domain [Clostridium sp.]